MEAVTNTAAKIIGKETRSLQEVLDKTLKKLQQIDDDQTHPLHPFVRAQRSKHTEGRFLSLTTKNARHSNSFLPTAIRLLNSIHKRSQRDLKYIEIKNGPCSASVCVCVLNSIFLKKYKS